MAMSGGRNISVLNVWKVHAGPVGAPVSTCRGAMEAEGIA